MRVFYKSAFIKLLFCILLIHGVKLCNAQTYRVIKKLDWKPIAVSDYNNNGSKEREFFTGAVFSYNSNLPVYFGRIKLNGNSSSNFKFSFSQVYFENVPEQDLKNIPDLSQIPDSIDVQAQVTYDRKVPYLQIQFLPFRKNGLTQKVERLKYFVLDVSEDKVNIKTKSIAVKKSYTTESILATGDWFKFTVSQSGIYQITYAELASIGLTDPQNVRIYGNGGKMLPEVFSGTESDDLKEIPILLVKGSDNVFNDGDYLLFYAEGPITWQYNSSTKAYVHSKHIYTNVISYFITSSPGGKKVELDNVVNGTPNIQVNAYDWHSVHEVDTVNLISSGRKFYGEKFGLQNSYDFTFSAPDLVGGEPVSLKSEVLARSSTSTTFQYLYQNKVIASTSVPYVYVDDDLLDYAKTSTITQNFSANAGTITLKLNFSQNGNILAEGWLNYLKLSGRQNLNYSGKQFSFTDSRSVGSGNIAEYSITNGTSSLQVWDVTDLNSVKQMNSTLSNGTLSFKATSDTLRKYVVFDSKSGWYKPVFGTTDHGRVTNQNLHGIEQTDFVIVTHPDFMKQAQELAEIHRDHDGITVNVVTPDEIYNEFSSGNPDPAAIRNFMKMLYDRATSPDKIPQNLLLFGDGSYDNVSPNKKSGSDVLNNTNFILTYQSSNSLVPVSSYVSDDYYGMLDNNEFIENGNVDVGVGRLPVHDTIQANTIISKIKRYLGVKSYGDWRNHICFISDDQDGNGFDGPIHMQQADQLATYINSNFPNYNTDKIYLDAFQEISTSSGQRYPDANTAIYNRINQGALIINYTGHGNERGLTHEQVIRQTEDIDQWKNEYLPLFVTATCEFSRFDNYKYVTTAGEDVLLNHFGGGGIALLTTTRLVYSGPNFVLNQQFYYHLFDKDENGNQLTLGEIMRRTKNTSGSDLNKLSFTLLGDPALYLAFPKMNVETDSINGVAISSAQDTIKAYQSVTVSGKITDEGGNKIDQFNGIVYPVVYDKAKTVATLANDGGDPFIFKSQNTILFKGQATVKNGEFRFSFVVPREIDYNFGNGKISYYATNGTTDAAGACSDFIIGGLNESYVNDVTGPDVRLFLNDTLFVSGGITDEYPTLLAKVWDLNGFNLGGNGIGHDIIATLDNDNTKQFTLNDYFKGDLDDYKKGTVEFPLPAIPPGNHQISLKIWDNFNNSSTSSITFKVLGGSSPSITGVKVYPNPMRDHTYFFFEHNQNNSEVGVTVDIYAMSGRLVRELNSTIDNTEGYTVGPLYWDGTDYSGNKILKGIYLYKVILRSKSGTAISKASKLVVIE